MGWWKALADVGLTAAAPFTGGASLAAIPLANAAIDGLQNTGQVAGNAAGASAQGRLAEAQANQNQDRNALSLFQDKNAQAQQALNQHSQLAHQAGQGDLMSNVQDVNISGLPSNVHMGNVTGGLRPSLLGPNARQAGQTLSRNALLQLMQGDTNLPKAPELTPLPQANAMDKINAGLGYAGSMAGAISPLFKPQPPVMYGQQPGFVNGNQFPNGIPTGDEDPNAFDWGPN